jgi:flavin reductase (DIM6/NTAB) family NADH-FMN oxidoreductase RutF
MVVCVWYELLLATPDAPYYQGSTAAVIDQATFRYVLGHFASGVTVITTYADNTYHGITVSSFCSLSLDPPLVLICIDRRVRSHDVIVQAGAFAVNILTEEGEPLSRHFASRTEDKFASVAYHVGSTGAPLLDGALATLDCRLHAQLPGGDHTIFVGEVVAASARDDSAPLLYYRGGYRRLD